MFLEIKFHRAARAWLEAALYCILPVLYPVPSTFVAWLVFWIPTLLHKELMVGFFFLFTFVVKIMEEQKPCVPKWWVFSEVRTNIGLIFIWCGSLYEKETSHLISSSLHNTVSALCKQLLCENKSLMPMAGSSPFAVSSLYMYLYPQFKLKEQTQKFQEPESQWTTG